MNTVPSITKSHYDWLDKNFPSFLSSLGLDPFLSRGLIFAHGDKCASDRYTWEKGGLHYFHGVAIYLLTYVHPYSTEVRLVGDDWVNPKQWVLQNKSRFLPFLPLIFEVDYDYQGT